jgi:SAM-dependent methyltransferase
MFYFKHYALRFFPSGAGSILDAGTGRASYARVVAKRFPEASVTGIDILPTSQWNTPVPTNLVFKQGDLTKLNEENSRDIIISIDVLEHIQHNEEVLKRFYRALRLGGVLYLAVPCESTEMHLFPQKWFSRFHEWEEHEHIGEQRTLTELTALVDNIGFSVLLRRSTFTLWGMLAWEVETLLSYGGRFARMANVLLMPLYKALGILDVYLPIGTGNNLIIAQKF